MGKKIDIFNPQVSHVAKGLEGKVILVYGGNNNGKTKVATQMEKPFYLPFEAGLNAIDGVPFCPINSWADFISINKQLTSPQTVDQAKELYSTIIFDEVEAASNYCQDYICAQYGVRSIGEGNRGYGLWKEYGTEFWKQINKLIGVGYTVYFIAHAQEKDGYIRPKGDTRAIDPIINNADICAYVKSNGVDENGRIIKSSAYFMQTDEYFARSRFDYIDTHIEVFSAENLEKAIADAIERQEKAEGIKAVEFKQQREEYTSEKKSYEELMEELQGLGEKFVEQDKFEDLTRIVEDILGQGKKAADLKKGQEQVIEALIIELQTELGE